MSYPPKHHQEQNFENCIKVMKQYPFGTLISIKDNTPYITHIPLIHKADGSKYGKLLAHIDKYNPQVATLLDNNEVTAIFHGPDCYISPATYSTKQLPTWNYLIVHIKGIVKRYTNPEQVKDTIIDMTSFLEAPEHRYTLAADNPRMEAAIDYIVGFEIEITDWEGKFKFSQDKNKKDQELAKTALIKSQQQDISMFLNAIYDNHKQ